MPLYMFFAVNCIYAVQNGANWLFFITAALTGAVLIFDILEVFANGRKK